jgi:hypothetical protein
VKCKNKEVIVTGLVQYFMGYEITICKEKLRVICTNDEKGKTLSVNDGRIQMSIPFEEVEEYFKD